MHLKTAILAKIAEPVANADTVAAQMDAGASKIKEIKRRSMRSNGGDSWSLDPKAYQRNLREAGYTGNTLQQARAALNMDDAKFQEMLKLEAQSKQAGSKAMADHLRTVRAAGRTPTSQDMVAAKEAAAVASKSVVEATFPTGSLVDKIKTGFNGGGRADDLKRWGDYRAKTNQIEMGHRSTMRSPGKIADADAAEIAAGTTSARAVGRLPAVVPNIIKAPLTAISGATGRYLGKDTASNKINDAHAMGYSTAAQQAPEEFRNKRNQAVTGFLKNNWGTLAGLGMGAMGLMALGRGRGQSGTAPSPTTAPTPAPDWTAQRSRGHGAYEAAGNKQQVTGMQMPTPSNIFSKFMNGAAS